MKVLAAVLPGLLATLGCAHSPAVSTSAIGITLNIIADGSFVAAFQGQTISAPGSYTFTVPAGAQDVSGQLTGRFVGFTTLSPLTPDSGRFGGPEDGTIRSIEGPSPHVERCSINFENTASPGMPQSFRFQFVASAAGGKCG